MLLEMFWELVSGDGTVHFVEYVEMKFPRYVQLIFRKYNFFLAWILNLWVPCGLSPLVYVIGKV